MRCECGAGLQKRIVRTRSVVRGESTTIYASSKLNRAGRRAARYDSGLKAHRYNQPARKRPDPHRIAPGQVACSRSRCGNLTTLHLPLVNPHSQSLAEQPPLPHNHARYDAAGNLLNDGVHSYAYNAENRITSVDAGSTATYLYDARNHAVTKTIFATDNQGEYAGSWDFLYDQSDRLITETAGNGSGALWRSEVFAGSRHLETSWDGNQYIDHPDHLGTDRARFDTNYSSWSTSTSLPFGDALQWNTSYGISQSAINFTGKERDPESGLDNFGARYDSSSMGRFMSPDPAGMFAVRLAYPQTLNRYSYVLNNRLSLADPLGLDCVYLNDSGTGIEKGGIDQNSSSGECGKAGGYWVEGTVTQVNIDSNATSISLQGTTNGTNTTSASYEQNTTLNVGWYQNTALNPFGHIALGIGNNTPVGLNPRSDTNYLFHVLTDFAGSCAANGNCYSAPLDALSRATVPGATLPQVGATATQNVPISITGMQATLIQNAINQSTQSPPPYSVFGPAPACDCGTWAQGAMAAGGVQSGPPAPIPQGLIKQLSQIYGPR